MPGGKVVLVMTRWHENDLAGYLLKQQEASPLADKWNVVRIPALNTAESTEKLAEARNSLIEQGYLTEDYPEPKVGEYFWGAPDRENGFCL